VRCDGSGSLRGDVGSEVSRRYDAGQLKEELVAGDILQCLYVASWCSGA